MEKMLEFPALQERLSYLKQALYVALQQNNDAVSTGHPDLGVQQWITSLRAEIRELQYALFVLTRDDQVQIGRNTILLIGAIMTLLLVTQVVILTFLGS